MKRILVIMSVAAVVAAMIAASAATIASAAQPAPGGFKNDCVNKNGVYTKDGGTQVCKWDTVIVDNLVWGGIYYANGTQHNTATRSQGTTIYTFDYSDIRCSTYPNREPVTCPF